MCEPLIDARAAAMLLNSNPKTVKRIAVRQLMTEKQVAETLQVSVSTLRYWRQVGDGPNWFKLHKLVRYDAAEVSRFIESGLRTSSARAIAEQTDVAL